MVEQLDSTMALGTTIRVFISSTFADFQTERDVLQRRVFPELRQLCAARGYRFQPIDLRWGVSEAAGNERQTLKICFDELDRCRALSPDCFMLILLGERYGSSLLPPTVAEEVAGLLLPHLAEDERAAFEATYRLDKNAVPAEYALLGSEGPARASDEPLRKALSWAAVAAGLTDDERLPFAGSATHREIARALLGTPPEALRDAGVLCALRSFASPPVGDKVLLFVEEDAERAEQVRRLREAVAARLPESQVLRYDVEWLGGGLAFEEDALAEAYLGLLRPKLEAVMAARTAARAALEAEGQDETALANAAFEAQRAEHVVGREDELARIAEYLASDTPQPLVVTGSAGIGKSTLQVEVAKRASHAWPNAVLIARYIGVTPGTESLSALLNGLRRSIARAYHQPEPAELDDENLLAGAVAAQLTTVRLPIDRPLLVVLDALDQLSTDTVRTDWLPSHLAPNVRVVVSLLDNRPEAGFLRSRLSAGQVLPVSSLGREAGQAMLRNLLAIPPHRILTPGQEEAVLAAFAEQGLPLYLRLLASAARRWRSFDPPGLSAPGIMAFLPKTIPELLETILQLLEAPERNGPALVARSLGDLAAARYGLAEDELLDLLALDGAVREAQRELSPNSPSIDGRLPLPMALWARLYAELAPLLAERVADDGVRLYTFYHRQLEAAVERRYLTDSERVERHRSLADYFAGQPWHLGPQHWNWRKVRELVPQQAMAQDRKAAEQALSGLADELEHMPIDQADDSEGIVAVIDALQEYIVVGSYWRAGYRFLTVQLAARRARRDRAGEAMTLNNLGRRARDLGRPEEAARHYREAQVIAREVGDRVCEGRALNNLGELASLLGQMEEAERYYQQALVIAREAGNRTGESATLNDLGMLARLRNRTEEAARYYEQSLAIAREVGDRFGEGITLHNLGELARTLHRLQEAGHIFKRALAIRRELDDRAGEAATLNSLGAVALERGQLEEATRYYIEALAIRHEIGDRGGEANTLNGLGVLARSLGRLEEAARYYEQALAIAREVGDRYGEGVLLHNLGTLTSDLGRSEEAVRYFEQALAVRHAIGNRAGEAAALKNLGILASNSGRPEEAVRYCQQALAIFEGIGAEREAGEVRGLLARLHSAAPAPSASVPFAPPVSADTRPAPTAASSLGSASSAPSRPGDTAGESQPEAAGAEQRRRWWPFGRRQ